MLTRDAPASVPFRKLGPASLHGNALIESEPLRTFKITIPATDGPTTFTIKQWDQGLAPDDAIRLRLAGRSELAITIETFITGEPTPC